MNMDGGRVLVPRSAVQRIQSMILDGTLKPGDRLPAQRELSEQFGISRASLREALSVLETLGLVQVEVGRGVFVLGPDGDGTPQAKWRFADRYSPMEVYETRLMLEPRSAALAARNVQTGLHYPKPLHLQQAYAHLGHQAGDFPVTERVASQCLTIPLFPEMTDDQQDAVVDALRDSLNEIG